jgi:hypothetical protein
MKRSLRRARGQSGFECDSIDDGPWFRHTGSKMRTWPSTVRKGQPGMNCMRKFIHSIRLPFRSLCLNRSEDRIGPQLSIPAPPAGGIEVNGAAQSCERRCTILGAGG